MKQQIKVWGSRVFVVGLLVVAMNHWGLPMYKQYFTPKNEEAYIPTTRVASGKFLVSFHEIGVLEAERSVPVVSQSAGRIISLVHEGIIVGTGERLVELDTSDLQREVRNLQLSYENAQADVRRVEAELEILREANRTEIEQSQAQLDFDENELKNSRRELEKQRRLAEDRLVPQSAVDKAEFDVRAKELSVLKGTKALSLKQRETESKEEQKKADVRNVEFRAHTAKVVLEEAEERMQQSVITAPSGGMVVLSRDWTPDGRRKLREGDNVRPRQTICLLPDLTSMLAKVQVGESDAPRVNVGMPVQIRLEAIPDKVFNGTVTDIAGLATEASVWETTSTPGRKNFEVTISIKESDPESLKPGMTADVEFICDVIDYATYVPLEAVVEREGKRYVFIREGDQFQRREVETGKRNDNFVCITSGLREGETVALRDPTIPLEEQEPGSMQPGSNGNDNGRQAAPIPIPDKE